MSKEEKGGIAMPSYINVTPFTRQYHQIKALENQVRQLKEHISAIENYNEQFLPHSELMERHISSQLFNIKDISVSEMKEIAGSIISKMKEMNEFDYVNNQILFLDYLMTHLGYERILISQTDDGAIGLFLHTYEQGIGYGDCPSEAIQDAIKKFSLHLNEDYHLWYVDKDDPETKLNPFGDELLSFEDWKFDEFIGKKEE